MFKKEEIEYMAEQWKVVMEGERSGLRQGRKGRNHGNHSRGYEPVNDL